MIAIKDEKGSLLTEKDDIKNHWKTYIKVLYDNAGKLQKENLDLQSENEVDVDIKRTTDIRL